MKAKKIYIYWLFLINIYYSEMYAISKEYQIPINVPKDKEGSDFPQLVLLYQLKKNL